MAMVQASRERGVPLIIPNAGNAAATRELCAPTIFRTSFTNWQPAFAIGKSLADRGVRRAAWVTWDYAAGKEATDGFREGLRAGGAELVRELTLPFPENNFQPIFGVMGVTNLAHGSLFMIGAYIAFIVAGGTGSLWLALFGRALLGIRANEHRMRSMGFDTYWLQLGPFTLAGALAGLAGHMWGMTQAFISPELLAWHRSAEALLMILLGGLGALHGPILGAFAFVGLGEVAQMITERQRLVEGLVAPQRPCAPTSLGCSHPLLSRRGGLRSACGRPRVSLSRTTDIALFAGYLRRLQGARHLETRRYFQTRAGHL
jgi:hypothetical protein